MKKIMLLFSIYLSALYSLNAQHFNVHLSAGAIGFGEGQVYPAYGFGIEAQASKLWTVFGAFDFGLKTNSSARGYLVNRTVFSVQPGVRGYFKGDMQGFNMSFYGV